jgi:hypothetical protein
LCIDLVVLPVRADEPDIDDAIRIIDPHHDAILVAGDVEHRATVSEPSATRAFSTVVCEAYCTSRRIRWSDTAHDLSTTLALNDSNVVLALQIKPELGTISKISTEPDGCISSDRPASIEYVRDATGRYAEIEREPICTELARF